MNCRRTSFSNARHEQCFAVLIREMRSDARRKSPSRGESRRTPTASCGVALVLVDVINDFEFPGSEPLAVNAELVAPNIRRLAARARRASIPVIYVNDNFGRWRSDFRATVSACTRRGKRGRATSLSLRPSNSDYFVLKPQHSGFYSTTLELLLEHLGATTLVLAGFAANLCILFTANDAHMRGYRVVAPADCTASNTAALTRAALEHVKSALHGETTPAGDIDFAALQRRSKRKRGRGL